MPTKLGKGGHGSENFDTETGKYIKDNSSTISKSSDLSKIMGVNVSTGSKSYVPEYDSKNNKRTFFNDLSFEEKSEILKNAESMFPEEFRKIREGGAHPTSEINTPERQAYREALLSTEITKQTQEKEIRKEGKAYIVLGLPGSGKSTIANSLIDKNGAYIIDADIFKNNIKEMNESPLNVSKVHEESVDLSNEMFRRVSGDKSNLVIGKVGGWKESIQAMVRALKDNGYEKIHIVLNDLPSNEAFNRAVDRYKSGKSKRLILPEVQFMDDGRIFDTYDALMDEPGVTSGSIYSNDVERGKNPVLLHSDGEKEEIF